MLNKWFSQFLSQRYRLLFKRTGGQYSNLLGPFKSRTSRAHAVVTLKKKKKSMGIFFCSFFMEEESSETPNATVLWARARRLKQKARVNTESRNPRLWFSLALTGTLGFVEPASTKIARLYWSCFAVGSSGGETWKVVFDFSLRAASGHHEISVLMCWYQVHSCSKRDQ